MDDELLSHWRNARVMNNPPPTLPDVAGPSDSQARSRIPGIIYYPQAPDDDHTVRGNTYFPMGTREGSYRHDALQLDSGYQMDYIPTSLELGYHNYQQTLDYSTSLELGCHNYQQTSDYTLQLPACGMIGVDDFQYIPEPEPEPGPGPGPGPEMVMDFYALPYSSAEFQHMPSLTSSDGTALAFTSDVSQTLSPLSLPNLQPAMEDLISDEAMAYADNTTDPTAAEIVLMSVQLTNAIPPFPFNSSNGGTTRSNFMGEASRFESCSSTVEHYAEISKQLLEAGPTNSVKGITPQGRCVRCRAMKIKCREFSDVCGSCRSVPYECCIRPEHLFPLFTSPDLYADLDADTIKRLVSPGEAPLRRRARIFLCSRTNKQDSFLTCEVDVYRLRFSDPSYSTLAEIGLWEDMRSPDTQKQFGWGRVLSCSLIPNSLPQKQIVHHWILESVRTNLSGVIGGIQSPLYKCAMCYITNAYRPLHQLVALALIHTSLYNVCHSKLSMVLENRYRAPFRVCPRLRAQVFAPLFLETGQELKVKLKEAVEDFRSSYKEQHLPLCLVMWMLMLMYLHCDVQTEKATSVFAHVQDNSLKVHDKKNPSFTPDLEVRRMDTMRSISTIKLLHKALFKRIGKPFGPIIDTKFRMICNKCNRGGPPIKCDHDNHLELKLSSLRRAVWLQQTGLEPWPNGPNSDMDDIIGRLPQSYEAPCFEFSDDEESGLIAPFPSENKLSVSEWLDLDAMSVDKQSSNVPMDARVCDLQGIREVLNEEVTEASL